MKKISAIVLAAAIMLMLFSGCTNTATSSAASLAASAAPASSQANASSEASEAKVTYPIAGNPTLTIMAVDETQVTSYFKSLSDTPFGKAYAEATGVTMDFTYLATADAFNLMLTSGKYPDIFANNWNGYTGGAAQAVKDNVIIALDPYTDQIPDYLATLHTDENWYKSALTPNGELPAFWFVRGDDKLLTSAGLIIRQDWLDELKLEIPQTPDELYKVLVEFRDKKGATAPFSCTNSWWLQTIAMREGLITSPFGLPTADFYQKDGTIEFGAYTNAYKDVLTWLNKLFTEGLLDANLVTLDTKTQAANIMGGVSGLTVGSTGGNLGTWLQTMAKNGDTAFNLSGMAPLVAKDGDTPMSTHWDNNVTTVALAISTSCKQPEIAAQFINYSYTKEGSDLCNFGVEGVSFNYANNYPTYTDLILKNPDGLTVQQALAQNTRVCTGSWGLMQKGAYIEQYLALDQQKEAITRWSTSDAKKYQLPNLTIAAKDADQYATLSAEIDTYVSEMTTKFITGVESLDNYDQYLATLKSMQVEEVIRMKQDALNEFNAR